MGIAWGLTKTYGAPVLRGVAAIFAGRKVGRIAGQAADAVDRVTKKV